LAAIVFNRIPDGVTSNARREPPLIECFRRNAAGMVTRPRVENRTVTAFFAMTIAMMGKYMLGELIYYL